MTPGRLIVFSAPSGAGKSSLISSIMGEIPHMRYSVSATTRAPRAGEIDGVHYFFMTRDGFQAMIHADEFAEWNEVHGNFYGTPRSFLDACTSRGEHVVLDLDVFGKRNFDRVYPDNIGILILPPSPEELERRLRGRNTDTEDVIQVRLRNARAELSAADSGRFSLRLVNDDFKTARAELLAFLLAEIQP